MTAANPILPSVISGQRPFIFSKLTIHILTVFDFGLQFYKHKEVRRKIITVIEDEIRTYTPHGIEGVKTKPRDFNPDFYDCEFIEINKERPAFDINFSINFKNKVLINNILHHILDNISEEKNVVENATKAFHNFIESIEKWCGTNTIPAVLMLESYGIGVLRTAWQITSTITVDEALGWNRTLMKTMDEGFFKFFVESILSKVKKIINEDKKLYFLTSLEAKPLTQYITGCAFISQDDVRDYLYKVQKDRNDFYESITNLLTLSRFEKHLEFIEETKKLNVSSNRNRLFIISRPSSVGIFSSESTSDYINRRIDLIERLYCQMFLLKRYNFALSDLIDQQETFHQRSSSELKEDINKIQSIQQEVLFLTEFFRNTYVASYREYRRMIDAGSMDFALSRAYDSIKEKLEHSHALVLSKLNEIRNNYVDFIQLAAFGVAATAVTLYVLNPLVLTLLDWLAPDMGGRHPVGAVLEFAGKETQKIRELSPWKNALLNLFLILTVITVVFIASRVWSPRKEVTTLFRKGLSCQEAKQRRKKIWRDAWPF